MKNRPHFWPSLVVAIMLFAGLAEWAYGYYQFLRFAVCVVSIYVALVVYDADKMWAVWVFGSIAVLFNPFIPIHFPREIWRVLDVACGIMFIVGASISKKPFENSDAKKREDYFRAKSKIKSKIE